MIKNVVGKVITVMGSYNFPVKTSTKMLLRGRDIKSFKFSKVQNIVADAVAPQFEFP